MEPYNLPGDIYGGGEYRYLLEHPKELRGVDPPRLPGRGTGRLGFALCALGCLGLAFLGGLAGAIASLLILILMR